MMKKVHFCNVFYYFYKSKQKNKVVTKNRKIRLLFQIICSEKQKAPK